MDVLKSNVIAYIRNLGGRSKLFTVDLDDKPLDPGQLFVRMDTDEDEPAWSPCANWLAYASNIGWKKYETGSATTTRNLSVVHFPEVANGQAAIYDLTHGSGAAHHPSWAGQELWSEWDANDVYDVPTVQDLRTSGDLADGPPRGR
jgi:hypothetical protein